MTRARKGKPRKAPPNRDRSYVEDIIDAAKHIQMYVTGITFDQFVVSALVRDAVLRRLTIIGEAAACTSAEFRAKTPGVPWRDIVAFRNLVVHRYWSVDVAIIWKIVNEEIPTVLDRLGRPPDE